MGRWSSSEAFGDELRRLLGRRGLSVSELALRAGVDPAELSRLLRRAGRDD